jgi:xanthosine utilization system XapX-like protein
MKDYILGLAIGLFLSVIFYLLFLAPNHPW